MTNVRQKNIVVKPGKRTFTLPRFINWQPNSTRETAILIDALGNPRTIPAPIYSKQVRSRCNQVTFDQAIAAFSECCQASTDRLSRLGLLSVRDLRKTVYRAAENLTTAEFLHLARIDRILKTEKRDPVELKTSPRPYNWFAAPPIWQLAAGQLVSPINQDGPEQLKRYNYLSYTPVELIELASGESFVRKKTPKKQAPLNDISRDFWESIVKDKEKAANGETEPPEFETGQTKREKNLKRYQVGDQMVSKGISPTGQRKIRLFGRALQNQAYKSNPVAKAKKLAYGSHITLTLPGQYPQTVKTFDELDQDTGEITTVTRSMPDYGVIKKMFRRFIDAFAYHVAVANKLDNAPLYYAWVIEEQERGAPHYHILFGHFVPLEAVKQLWSNQVSKWKLENKLPGLTDNETNAIATIVGVKSFSNYLTKYFLKQDMAVPGQCWGLSKPANDLIKSNLAAPLILFERYQDAIQFVATAAEKIAADVNDKGQKMAAMVTNLRQHALGFYASLKPDVPKYKPPSVWTSNPVTAVKAFLSALSEATNDLVNLNLDWPQSASRKNREPINLYAKNELVTLAL